MSRIPVYGNYEGHAFVLRKENGDVYQEIKPDTIFGIGQFDSYFAKRIRWGNKPTIALIKLGNNMSALKIRELKRKTRLQKGFILKPGKGLWATTAGSAHCGVWHLLKNVDDPILITLWSHKLPTNILQVVSEIDYKVYQGGNLSRDSKAGSYAYGYETDGNICELRPVLYSSNVRAKLSQFREATIQVVGGTYCVQAIRRKENNGKSYTKISAVIITAVATKAEVAEAINRLMS